MTAHVFVDNSNVFLGAKRAAMSLEPEAPRAAVRVHYQSLFDLIEGGHQVTTRVLAGSVPPGNDGLWDYARRAGYDTNLLQKVTKESGRQGEQGVDELLHLKIANALLDFEPPQTLVLVTGDAKKSDFDTSFLKQVERALKRDWNVHVWSWKEQLSPKYAALTRPGKPVHVHHFDGHYIDLVYLERGYFNMEGKDRYFDGRPVGRRPKTPSPRAA